jgi:hypothetical protein
MQIRCSNSRLGLLLSIGLMLAPAARGQNLIVNPYINGFYGWNGTYGLYSGAVNPPPMVGNTVAWLDGGEPPMFQSFPTVPGLTYEVSWNRRLPDLGGNGVPILGESTVGPGLLNISLNGQFMQDMVVNRTTWQSDTVDFVATATATSLSFSVSQYLPGGARSESVFFDYVSAVQVPEPAVSGMVLMGILVCGWPRRAKH